MVTQLPSSTPKGIIYPDSDRFLTHLELDQQLQQEKERAEQAEAKLEALHTLLKERGINPEQL
ncbi:hypothetical protein A6S26_04845 [Nostoc sp. ATCC 43529]|nr:hypothetical protein A6S26_04845 [Nostoc sp. ATCC 43529]